MMNGVKTVDCAISNVALNDLARWENAQLPDRDAQFLSFRDLIEKGSIGHIRTKRIQPGAGFLQACFRAGAKGEEMIGKNSPGHAEAKGFATSKLNRLADGRSPSNSCQ